MEIILLTLVFIHSYTGLPYLQNKNVKRHHLGINTKNPPAVLILLIFSSKLCEKLSGILKEEMEGEFLDYGIYNASSDIIQQAA